MNLFIKNIKQLITVNSGNKPFKSGKEMRDLGIIENATVMIQDGLFSWIGQSNKLSQEPDDSIDIIDASELIALPGFVDSHTHSVFAGSRENEFAMRTEGKSYREIAEAGGGILSTVRATREMPKKELKKINQEEKEFKQVLCSTIGKNVESYREKPCLRSGYC